MNPTKPLVHAASLVSPTGTIELRSTIQFLNPDHKAAFVESLGMSTPTHLFINGTLADLTPVFSVKGRSADNFLGFLGGGDYDSFWLQTKNGEFGTVRITSNPEEGTNISANSPDNSQQSSIAITSNGGINMGTTAGVTIMDSGEENHFRIYRSGDGIGLKMEAKSIEEMLGGLTINANPEEGITFQARDGYGSSSHTIQIGAVQINIDGPTVYFNGLQFALGGRFTTTGGHAITLNAPANSSVTLPPSGTLLSNVSSIFVLDGNDVAGDENQSISNWLDAGISPEEGAVIFRGPDGWIPLSPGAEGYVLTMTGGAAPEWAPAAGGGDSRLTFTLDFSAFGTISSGSSVTVDFAATGVIGGTPIAFSPYVFGPGVQASPPVPGTDKLSVTISWADPSGFGEPFSTGTVVTVVAFIL
jgi:hypothetical protein